MTYIRDGIRYLVQLACVAAVAWLLTSVIVACYVKAPWMPTAAMTLGFAIRGLAKGED